MKPATASIPRPWVIDGAKKRSRPCAELGVDRVEFLDYVDSGMAGRLSNDEPMAFCNASVDSVSAEIAELLAGEELLAVIGYDANGTYGHPDHLQIHAVAHTLAPKLEVPWLLDATYNREYLASLPRERRHARPRVRVERGRPHPLRTRRRLVPGQDGGGQTARVTGTAEAVEPSSTGNRRLAEPFRYGVVHRPLTERADRARSPRRRARTEGGLARTVDPARPHSGEETGESPTPGRVS